MPDVEETAALLTTELVTNAVRASAPPDSGDVPVVRLWMRCDRVSIVIHVWDGSEEMPIRRDAGPGAESGWGLMLVNSLSKEWGAHRTAGGKVVWVML